MHTDVEESRQEFALRVNRLPVVIGEAVVPRCGVLGLAESEGDFLGSKWVGVDDVRGRVRPNKMEVFADREAKVAEKCTSRAGRGI